MKRGSNYCRETVIAKRVKWEFWGESRSIRDRGPLNELVSGVDAAEKRCGGLGERLTTVAQPGTDEK